MSKFALIIVALILPFATQAFPAFPMAFWGNVTINGSPAPAGTVIRAYYGNTLAGQAVVHETGIYGYTEPTKQKLLLAEGSGAITFRFQSSAFNGGAETEGLSTESHPGFTTGDVINKNFAFSVSVPVAPPPSSGGGSGSGGGGGSTIIPQGIVAGTSTTTAAAVKKGDASGDGKVDIFDFNTLMISWGTTPKNPSADLDKNGKVDIFDFNILMINWGK